MGKAAFRLNLRMPTAFCAHAAKLKPQNAPQEAKSLSRRKGAKAQRRNMNTAKSEPPGPAVSVHQTSDLNTPEKMSKTFAPLPLGVFALNVFCLVRLRRGEP